MKCLIIIPAYNEAENIDKVVNDLKIKCPQFDYIVINDGSNDETKKVCEKNGYNILNLPINMGIGGAVQTGYIYARENDYDVAVQIDGDGQHDVIYTYDMIRIMQEQDFDIIIGSRFINKVGFQSSVLRRIGIYFLSFWGNILTGVKIKDITSGYRLVNRKFISIFAEDYPSDYPEPEAIVISAVHGGKIKEFPVVMHERENGNSSITLGKSIYYMIKVTLAMFVRRLSLGVRRQK